MSVQNSDVTISVFELVKPFLTVLCHLDSKDFFLACNSQQQFHCDERQFEVHCFFANL